MIILIIIIIMVVVVGGHLLEGGVFVEGPDENVVSHFVAKVTTEYAEVVCGGEMEIGDEMGE